MNRTLLVPETLVEPLLAVPSGPLQIAAVPEASRPQDRVGLNPALSIVIPTYGEAANIEQLVKRVDDCLSTVLTGNYEIIVVDDDSPDGTWKAAQSLMSVYPRLQVMRRVGERGLSTAVIRGWQAARGEILGVIDGDLQHPPEVLLKLWAKMEEGADLAVASRNVDGGGVSDWSFARRILSRGAQILGLIVLPEVVSRVSDPMSGYFLARRRSISGVRLSPIGYKILVEVLGRGRFAAIGEAGYVFQERRAGESKVTSSQYLAYLRHIVRLRLCRLPFERLIRFGMVGLSGVAVDMAIFYELRHHSVLPLALSAAISAEIAILNNFSWNETWTFRDRARTQPAMRQRAKRLVKFNAICLAGLALHLLILTLIFHSLGANEYMAKAIAIVIVTAWNYWINLHLSWRVTDISPTVS